MKKIYLDYAASAPLDKKVLKEMMPYVKKEFGNPSSLHGFGQKAKAAIEKARQITAKFLHCQPLEVVFTSGATEANNLAIQGVARYFFSKKCHIITSKIEHESVLSPCQELERQGLAEVTYLPVDSEGFVRVGEVQEAIKENTALVSLCYANSEIGTIESIAEIGAMLRSKILFHTDAVQAAQFLDCDVKKLGVDLLTLSGHKIYGPKGVGALYVREGIILDPLLFGGGQEQGFRSGTENAAAIVGMGAAIAEIQNPKSEIRNIQIRQLRDKLIKGVLSGVSGSSLTGSRQKRLPNNVHFLFEGIDGRELDLALDQKGIAVSTGSACSEKTDEASHVLLALGISEKTARSALRVTLGKYTTLQEIQKTIKCIKIAVDRLRSRQV